MSSSSRLTVVVLLVTIPFWHADGVKARHLAGQPMRPILDSGIPSSEPRDQESCD